MIIRLPRKNYAAGFLVLFIFSLFAVRCFGFSEEEIGRIERTLRDKPVGERIAGWAEKFVGTPYDGDPQGIYVTRAAIVVDEKVDCMYLTFRSVELALGHTPEEAIQIALQKRFHKKGRILNGKVENYEDRYEYGEDMIVSGKWGKEITRSLGQTKRTAGTRGKDFWEILPKREIRRAITRLRSGDLLFFIRAPERRTVGESVGHMGIVKVELKGRERSFYLIHASGSKNKGGMVKKVLLKEYVSKMPFIGVQVTRFQ